MIWKTAADSPCHTDDAQSVEATSLTGNHEITSWGGSEEGKVRLEVGTGGRSLLSICAIVLFNANY